MKLKTGISALAIAGSLVAAPALAQVDYREDPYAYQDVERDEPISSNLPGQNLAGLQLETEQERIARLEREREQARLEAERRREAARMQAELERERARQQAAAQQREQIEPIAERQGKTRIEWGYYEPTQANTAVVPPPLSPQFITELQQYLQARGLNPGQIDGNWGVDTYQALEQYQQQAQGLAASGQLTPQTLAELNLERSGRQRAEAPQQGQQPQG